MRRTIFIALAALLMLPACAQEPVINRWIVAGYLKQGKLQPLNTRKTLEYEFLKGGRMNIYENGVIKETGSFKSATDKKSILITLGDEAAPLKIVKLNKTEFRFVADALLRKHDTMVCYAANSPQAKAAADKGNSKKWQEVAIAWSDVNADHIRRADLAANLIQVLAADENFDKTAVNALRSARDNAQAFELTPENLTAQTIRDYQSAQAAFRKAIHHSFDKANESPALKTSQYMTQIRTQFEGLENSISISIRKYNSAVIAFNATVKDKAGKKYIAFKPE